jgi:hypothetical protein
VTCNYRWIGAVAIVLALAGSSAEAQPIYGGGYWGGGYGGGGGQTVQGSIAKGMGVYAMGAGQYNLDTAQAASINSDTAMRWNQYIYNSRIESQKMYHSKMARDEEKNRVNGDAVRERLRNNPNSVDISRGNALNVALDELIDPKVFPKATYYGHKIKLGGETIRDIPFAYASAAISTSVHQLMNGGPPPSLKAAAFDADRAAMKPLADELRKQGAEGGQHDSATIEKLKGMILALRPKVEATYPKNSRERNEAEKYLKAVYGLLSMFETPAVNVLLAGVEKRPEATLGDLLGFMAAYNLRFGVAETPRQKDIYRTLYPMLAKLRDDTVTPGGTPSPEPVVDAGAPGEVFDGLGYKHAEKAAAPPSANPPR